MGIDWQKIDDNKDKIDAEIIGFVYRSGKRYELEIDVDGDGVMLMTLLAAGVKCISEDLGFTPEKVMTDLQGNYQYLVGNGVEESFENPSNDSTKQP